MSRTTAVVVLFLAVVILLSHTNYGGGSDGWTVTEKLFNEGEP